MNFIIRGKGYGPVAAILSLSAVSSFVTLGNDWSSASSSVILNVKLRAGSWGGGDAGCQLPPDNGSLLRPSQIQST